MNRYLKNLFEEMKIDSNMVNIKEIVENVVELFFDKQMLEELNETYFIKWAESGVFKDSEERAAKLKKKPTKDYLIETMVLFLTEKEIFEKAYNSMENVVKEALFIAVWYNEADIEMLYKKYKTNIKNSDKSGRMLDARFRFFRTREIYRGIQKGTLELHPIISGVLREVMPKPVEMSITGKENIDTDYVGNYESEIIENITLLLEMRKTGDIRLGANGKILKTVFSYFEKNVVVREFYENSRDEEERRMKKELLIRLFSALRIEKIGDNLNPVETLKEIVEKIFSGEAFLEHFKYYGNSYSINMAKTILSNLKVKLNTYEDEEIEEYLRGIKYCFEEIAEKNWVTIEDIVKFLFFNAIPIFTYSEEFIKNILRENEIYPYRNMEQINKNVYEFIIFPFTKGIMAIMAVLGVVEIGYNNREGKTYKEHNSLYNGIKFVRVTELGKYILGINKSYEFEQKESAMELNLSDKELIITASGSDRIKEIVISKIAEKVGENIYKVTNRTLFAGCTKEDDVKAKINSFKKNCRESA